MGDIALGLGLTILVVLALVAGAFIFVGLIILAIKRADLALARRRARRTTPPEDQTL